MQFSDPELCYNMLKKSIYGEICEENEEIKCTGNKITIIYNMTAEDHYDFGDEDSPNTILNTYYGYLYICHLI